MNSFKWWRFKFGKYLSIECFLLSLKLCLVKFQIYFGNISSLLLQIVEKSVKSWCHLSNNWRPDVACINWNDFDPKHNLDPTQWDELFFQNPTSKGQLISKCLFGIFNSPKKSTKKNQLYYYCTSSLIVFVRFFGRIENTKKIFRN